jgi:hypothetical protein
VDYCPTKGGGIVIVFNATFNNISVIIYYPNVREYLRGKQKMDNTQYRETGNIGHTRQVQYMHFIYVRA